ncbi:hypothetical protein Back2_00360 [Nocardioides baekrokdamisoli]|uniref:Glycosyl hydrolases family 39 N-terminal catalytic domain-containing protein n=1 Tax=Nocardioides baekrokdamisoli TaxID=1804624 RepID=A0A3G9IYK8_9ACTN|nr:cellulase family glycosylhydrolase [Nocardioides baekrokdamisoli]BBH15749.1 hypothetical protein Back2_00360 [Nocardioides baekrokdamisoli]
MLRDRRKAVAIAIIGTVALAGGWAAASEFHGDRHRAPLAIGVGFNDSLAFAHGADVTEALSDAKAVGATWVRVDLPWDQIQPTKSGPYDWTVVDKIVTTAHTLGLHVLPVLGHTPPWARGACTGMACPPARPTDVEALMDAAVRRYAPDGVHAWEIWNEPNSGTFWQQPDARAYAQFFTAASRAAKSVDPGATIVVGGLDACVDGVSCVDPRTFMDAFCRAGGCASADAVGVHPYTYPLKPGTNSPAWEVLTGTTNSVLSVLAADGYSHIPLWITAYGAPTDGPGASSDGSPAQLWPHPSDHVTEAYQAELAKDFIGAAEQRGQVAAVFWAADRDDPRDSRSWSGLRRKDGTPKPAWAAFNQAVTAAQK